MTAPAHTELDVYRQVHDEYLANAANPAWRMAFEIALGEWMGEIATAHQGPIQAIADRAMLRQLSTTRDDIAKRFLLSRLEEIRKDKAFDPTKHPRDKHGLWARKGGGAAGAVLDQRVADIRANKEGVHSTTRVRRDAIGMLAQPITLDIEENAGDHEAEALRRMAAMTYALEERTLSDKDKQRIQYTVVGPKGSRVVVPPIGQMPGGVDYNGGERIQHMVPVGPDHPVTVAGKVMDIGLAAGLDPENAAKAGSVVADIHDSLNTTDWGKRLNNVANVARVVTNNSPLGIQAHAVASLINLLGPDAARAFGPKMRQLSYRYTGQEARPEQFSNVARDGKQETTKGELETTQGFEARLALDLAKGLPTETEYKAALQAGTTPPSKGYLLNRHGKVVSESVGFADDWYTPFNLKRLPKLKGGSYVRTRGYGGITPEDLQLALHTGAQRVTVVSNSGVFSLELDDRARNFGHRFGFGGTAMQRRYAKSLDAIANDRVENSQSPTGKLKLDHLGYKTALSDLKRQYPYFVTSVRVEPPINAAAPREEGEGMPGAPNTGAIDAGYVRPLSIKASGAQYGWADRGVSSSYNEGQRLQGKTPYDQLDRYRLARSGDLLRGAAAVAAVANGSGSGNGNGNGGNGNGAQPTHRTDTPQAGGSMQDPAYNNPAERLSTPDANRLFADLKAIVSAHPDVEAGDFDVVRETLLNADHGGPDWTRMRDKLRDSPEYRASVLGDIDEYFGATKEAQELLPGMSNLAVGGDEEDEGDDGLDEDGFYTDSHLLPDAVITSSPRVSNWINAVRGRTDAESVKLAKDFEWFRDQMARNHAKGDWDIYGELSKANQERFDNVHHAVITMINDDIDVERDRKLNPETDTKPDSPRAQQADAEEQRARAPQGVVSFNSREALESPLPKNYAMDTVKTILESTDDPEQIKASIYRYQSAARTAAKQQALEKDRKKLETIAEAFGEAVTLFEDFE